MVEQKSFQGLKSLSHSSLNDLNSACVCKQHTLVSRLIKINMSTVLGGFKYSITSINVIKNITKGLSLVYNINTNYVLLIYSLLRKGHFAYKALIPSGLIYC